MAAPLRKRGLDGYVAVRERHPDLKTIVVSSRQEPEDVEAAFAAGAAAYVFKTAEAGDVALAIRQTYESSVFFARSDYLSRNGARVSTATAAAMT